MLEIGTFARQEEQRRVAEAAASARESFATGLGGLLAVMGREQPCDLSGIGTQRMADTLMAMPKAQTAGVEDPVAVVANQTGQPEELVRRHVALARQLGHWLLEKAGDTRTTEQSAQIPVDKQEESLL